MASSNSNIQEIKVKRSYPLPVIATISGTISQIGLNDVVLETNGIGYAVNVTTSTALELNLQSEVKLHTAHIIREDSQSLYGFITHDELKAFNLLCSVSGVGPKSALSVVGSLGVEGLAQAVASADDSMFRSVTGIGPKTAKLIVLSLTGKLVTNDSTSSSITSTSSNVVSALVGLGYQERMARKAVDEVSSSSDSVSEAELLRKALSQLSSARKISSDE